MKILTCLISIIMILGMVGCNKLPHQSYYDEVVIDNRTPYKFMVIVNNYYKGDLLPGGVDQVMTIRDKPRNLQLRTWQLLDLIIISTEIEFGLKKIILTLDDRGDIRIEFVGR